MSFGGGAKAPPPPPPPPPPPNPPTYASAAFNPPATTGAGALPQGIFQGSILTSPLGAADQRATQRKQLFGQ